MDEIFTERVNELEVAFRRNNWSSEEISRLTDDTFLRQVRRELFCGRNDDAVDLSADPFVPDGWTVEEHVRGGKIAWQSVQASLLYADAQRVDGSIKGDTFLALIEDEPIVNAVGLDHLLAHSRLIPSSWRALIVHFFGTVYRDPAGFPCVRHLRWSGGAWQWGRSWLGDDFGLFSPAVVLATPAPEPSII